MLERMVGARAAERGQAAAWLRIYLGYAPGVGKTYAMLAEGRRRRARGTDVVVGWVEPHGRPRTLEGIGDLEVVPGRAIEHRGVRVEEMDVDAVIARRPQMALVDELAHGNAPGSRNQKRYQDVLDLLASGVNVISTVNVQHLAGLQETVRLIAGVGVTETVPDWIVDTADELEIVDQTPEALRKRLRHGNVYAKEHAAAALEGFFRISNLIALRELTLRRVAEHAARQREQYAADQSIRPSSTGASDRRGETVLVAVPASDQAQQLVRRGVHLAARLGARLVVLHVTQPGGALGRTGSTGNQAATKALQLARELGAEVVAASCGNVAAAIARRASELGATQIVVGESGRSRLRELLRGSIVGDVLRRTRDTDVHVVKRVEP
jgi:two-component system sensor histidine kinase KdpD